MQTTPIIDSLERFERDLHRAQTFVGTPHRKSENPFHFHCRHGHDHTADGPACPDCVRERLEHRKMHAERILFEWACQEVPDTAGTKTALAAYGWKCDFRTMRGNVAELEDAQTGRLHDVEF